MKLFVIILVIMSAFFAFLNAFSASANRNKSVMERSYIDNRIIDGTAGIGARLACFATNFVMGLITPLYLITAGILAFLIQLFI